MTSNYDTLQNIYDKETFFAAESMFFIKSGEIKHKESGKRHCVTHPSLTENWKWKAQTQKEWKPTFI